MDRAHQPLGRFHNSGVPGSTTSSGSFLKRELPPAAAGDEHMNCETGLTASADLSQAPLAGFQTARSSAISQAPTREADLDSKGPAESQRIAAQKGYLFGPFRLDEDDNLSRGEEMLHLPPKELRALRLLLDNGGKIVTARQLKAEVWSDVNVTADSVPQCISSLRARLEPENCIQTVYKRGYRFVAEVKPYSRRAAQRSPRLAIMPFTTGFGVPEHYGMVIAEETAARLANLPERPVSILARDSVFTLAKRGMTAQQLGEALKTDLVLTGSLKSLPVHFRLRAEMVRVEDGTQAWIEDILVPKARIAGLESELTQRLLFRLNAEGVSISAAAEESGSKNYEAYETFQRAHYEWQTMQRHQMQDGLQHLTRVAELDPSLVAAKVDLVHLCVTQTFYGFMSPTVAAELVHRTADSIPALESGATAILPALGWINFHWDHNLPAATWAFTRSAHLGHNSWDTRVRTMFQLSRGQFADAIATLKDALYEDPYAPWLHSRLAWALHLDGQRDASVEQVRQSAALFPDHEGANLYGAMILAYNGEAEAAMQFSAGLAQRLPYFDLAIPVHAYALACAGHSEEASSILERLQWLSRERFVLRSFMPAAYVALGDHDSALSELRVSEDSRCPWFFQTLIDPRLTPLHGNSEFERMRAVLTRMEDAQLN